MQGIVVLEGNRGQAKVVYFIFIQSVTSEASWIRYGNQIYDKHSTGIQQS